MTPRTTPSSGYSWFQNIMNKIILIFQNIRRTGIDFIKQGYGLTEVTMACLVDLTSGEKVGSCGTPAPGMKVKVGVTPL